MRGSLDRLAIKGHLARTCIRLRLRDASHLEPDRRARREWAIRELGRYWRTQPLPRNAYGLPRTPIFEDDAGRRCAVAHLVWESGGEGVVARIRERQNLAYVPEIEDEQLPVWAANHGLDLDELADIQPAYSRGPDWNTTIWVAGMGVAGLIAGLVAMIKMVRESRWWKTAAFLGAFLILGLAVLLTITVTSNDSGPCDALGCRNSLPRFALPILVLLWSLIGILAVVWIKRTQGVRARTSTSRQS